MIALTLQILLSLRNSERKKLKVLLLLPKPMVELLNIKKLFKTGLNTVGTIYSLPPQTDSFDPYAAFCLTAEQRLTFLI